MGEQNRVNVMLSFSFHIGDWIKDTYYLSDIERSKYLMLMIWYYESEEPLPLDMSITERLANATNELEIKAVHFILNRFFKKNDDGYRHTRIDAELIIYKEKSKKAKENGKLGGLAKAKQISSECLPNLQPLTNNLKPDNIVRERSSASRKVNEDLIAQAKGLIDHLNKKAHREFGYGDAIIKPIVARLKEYTIAQLFTVIDNKCAQWLTDETMSQYLRPATLFNASKCAQYVGEIGAPTVTQKPWFLITKEIEKKGDEAGITKIDDWRSYRAQVFNHYGITPSQYKEAKNQWDK